MNIELLNFLADPETGEPFILKRQTIGPDGRIDSGELITASGREYPIRDGVPRFVVSAESVVSFGDEWNHFNFVDFKANWLAHTVANTFGSTDAFKDKVIVDAGGGSGSQTLWMLESGAKYVILLELSHSVDDVIKRNLGMSGFRNYDVIQCSIDRPPLRRQSIDGIVICHNVIQHTESVERTARALWNVVDVGGEFVFNCYPLNDHGALRWVRVHLIYAPLRAILSRLPFAVILTYSRVMGALRCVPVLGLALEKLNICVCGDVSHLPAQTWWARLVARYRATVLNTFDCFGSHTYQHLKADEEIEALVRSLQPDESKVRNREQYFRRPQPIGCALRIAR
jgi:2-polyprenyl-3-methyl-5-hydroxy-6-metoxy-1,4-benzoquinol methylase/uncharacterized protein YbaR (Trm112 family)